MIEGLYDELREQGRGVIGALVVAGVSFLYTMEAWWLGWQLPATTLLAYAFVGLAFVLVVTRNVGFRQEQEGEKRNSPWRVAADFGQLVLQSFVTAYVVWHAASVPASGPPETNVVNATTLSDGSVRLLVELRNEQDVGLVSATVEADCDSPPPDLTFDHVPADGRLTGYIVCPPGSSNATVSISTWVQA